VAYGRNPENHQIAISQWKIIQFWWNLDYKSRADLELGDSHVMKFFKIQDGGRPSYWKSFFDHNLAADCPISVKFCVKKQFLQNFGTRTDTRVPQNVFLVFFMQFGLRWAGAFRIVSYILITNLLLNMCYTESLYRHCEHFVQAHICIGCCPLVVRSVIISQTLSKIDPQLLWIMENYMEVGHWFCCPSSDDFPGGIVVSNKKYFQIKVILVANAI